MKTSARNHFSGTVSRIEPGAVNDEIELTLASGLRIIAVITRTSTESLGLTVGASAFALIKASSVIVAVGAGRLSARNQFAGTVAEVRPGAVNAEVLIDLGGGLATLVAMVTLDSVRALGLLPGIAVSAVVKASNVLIGIDD